MQLYTADSYFHIGATHVRSGLPCEDYALAHASDSLAYAIVSDGCSSGGRTDVGARVLAHLTARALEREKERTGFPEAAAVATRVEVLLDEGRLLLGLTEYDMLATALVAVLSNAGGYVRLYGDGVVARGYDDGVLVLSAFSWADNTPYYQSYGNGTAQTFVEAHGGDLAVPRLTEERVTIREGLVECEKISHTLAEGMAGVHIAIGREEAAHLHTLAVFSDGLMQVEGVSWVQAVQDALAFRTTNGAFLKRRMIRQLKTYERDGFVPYDDVAGAVLVRSRQSEET